MKFNEVTIRILVRGDYGACFDFYKEKIGLVPVWGDRNGPYTSFAVKEGEAACFAIFEGAHMSMFKDYVQPTSNAQPDTITCILPSEDLDGDYNRLKAAGVEFIGEPTLMEAWGMRCIYFRDIEGNLFELNDATSV